MTASPPNARRLITLVATLVALAGALALTAGCPSSPLRAGGGGGALEGPTDPGGGGGMLAVVNPTDDTWDLKLDGAGRGSVGPRSEARIPNVKAGAHVVVAENASLGIDQRGDVQVSAGQTTTHTLKPLVSRLKVSNPHDVAVEIVIDGVVIGRAAPKSDTVFEAVPAGKRMLVARAPTGPGAVRVEQRLAPNAESAWTVPALAESGGEHPSIPTPPTGMGLVHMKNDSRFPVYVYADGADKGLVAPAAWVDIILSPGDHKLEVKIEGIEARTEHTVTLRPNQVAEWIWGTETR